jgi:hypothetical protein
MIGIFLVNQKDELCFAQYGEHKDIAGFRFHTDTGMCIAVLATGGEETFVDAMHDEIRPYLSKEQQVLVADLDDDGQLTREYSVGLAVAR